MEMEKDAPEPGRQPIVGRPARTPTAALAAIVVPALIADAGEHVTRRILEFFAASIRNKNTRMAYLHAVGRFFARCERHRLGQLAGMAQFRSSSTVG